MVIEAGQQLLHYRLIEKIGEGGMGVVWKALDTSLDREVAIKILPETLAGDTQRVARFEREAKLLATLNHASIAAVYGFYEADAPAGPVRFLVMELVPGEDLARRLQRGRLPLDESLAVARQIAEALEAAHARGVVHRDLKPANVRMTAGGAVKVLDFGLAKAMAPAAASDSDPSLSPTVTSVGSIAGALLGTAAYMSPEQVRGMDVDERSDVWAFGCVLWECLTGKTLFGGATASDSLGAILHTEPDEALLPPDTPATVRRVLRRCLAKDPRRRFHHVADARIELEDTDVEASTAPAHAPARGYKIAIALLAIALVASLAVLLPSRLGTRNDSGSGSRIENPLAGARFSKITDYPGSEVAAAISPDGSFVAFASDASGAFEFLIGPIRAGGSFSAPTADTDVELKDVDANVRSVGFNHEGTELWFGGGTNRRLLMMPLLGGSTRLFLGPDVAEIDWSPDGERVVYHTSAPGDPTFVADRDGANERLVLGSEPGVHQHYPTWSVDGRWIYVSRGRPSTLEMSLWRVAAGGGEPEQLTHGQLDVRDPTPLDERTVLYTAREASGAGPWLWSVDVETKVSRRLTIGLEQYVSLSASADRSRLVASVQDPRARLWTVPILERPATERDAEPHPDLEKTRAMSPRVGGGSLFFLSTTGSSDGLWRLHDGKVTEVWGSETALLEPAAVAPDGRSVVLRLQRQGEWRLHLLSADGAVLRLFSEDFEPRGTADWSPDGEWVICAGSHGGADGLFKIPVERGAPELIVEGDALNPLWSPNGDLIVYAGPQVRALSPLKGVRPDGTPVELPDIQVLRGGARARFLPDGSGLVYMLGEPPPAPESRNDERHVLGRHSQDFWLLNLTTMESRQLTRLDAGAVMRSFDVTSDGRRIVFDRIEENSDIVLIELDRGS